MNRVRMMTSAWIMRLVMLTLVIVSVQIDLRWDTEEIRITVKPGASVTRRQLEDAIERAEYPYNYSISP